MKGEEKIRSRRATRWLRRYSMSTVMLRPLPDYVIIGAQKGGTNFINDSLCKHPYCRPTEERRVSFFDSPHYTRGVRWYRSHFPILLDRFYAKPLGRPYTLTGDYCPGILVSPYAAKRMAKVIPHAKLLVTLRNPVDRAYSQYQMRVRRGGEDLSFEEAIDAEEERLSGEVEKMLADENYWSGNHKQYSYLKRGRYIEQLEEFAKYFDRKQILVFKNEDMRTDAEQIFIRMQEFLGLPRWMPKEGLKPVNVGTYSDMKPETRKRLSEYYAPYNQRLYEFLGEDFGWE